MFCICVLIIAAAAVYMVEAYIHTYYAIEYKPTNKRLNRILPGALMAANGKLNVMVASRGLHNGIPDNYVFDNNSKAKPSKCTLINKNKGIVFVSNSVS